MDFGLAKISQSGKNTTTGAQALTPGYAPPEQYGQGTEPRSDIYSLGATLYAVLTGKVPEDGLSRAMGTTELTPVRTHRPGVSERTAGAIEKAMAVLPTERFQTGSEFSTALGPSDLPVEPAHPLEVAHPPAPPQPPLPPRRRPGIGPRGWFAGIALAAIVLVALLLLILPGITRPPAVVALDPTTPVPPTAGLASIPTEPATLTPAPLPTETTAPTLMATRTFTPEPSPTLTLTFTPAGTPLAGGGEIAFASDRSGIPQIWAMRPDGSGLRQVTQLTDGACQPDWDARQARIVFVSPCQERAETHPGSSLYLINADGTGLVLLPTLPGGDFDPAWSPDGQTIAFTSLRGGRSNLYLMRLADFTVTRLSSPVNYERLPAWSPDGALIAYETTRAGFPQIWLMQADGANPREFSPQDSGRSSYPAWSPDGSVLVYTQGGSPTFLVGRQTGDPQAVEIRISEELTNVHRPVFSPDGWWLAVDSLVNENDEIYILLRSGGSLARLTDHPAADFDPAW